MIAEGGARGAHRPCPFCRQTEAALAYPFESRFDDAHFHYWRCASCGVTFIDPVPSAAAFERMYAPSDYHDCFYDGGETGSYAQTAARIASFCPAGARILDFGCGGGQLLKALRGFGLDAVGVEFSAESARNAAAFAQAEVFGVDNPAWHDAGPWDAIHLGDVIEHLPDPLETVGDLIGRLKPGGILSAEGPLESNRSLVHLAAMLYAAIKRRGASPAVPEFPPYHLIFANERAQRAFFARLGLDECVWSVTETGWPYRSNGVARDMIARAAIALRSLPVIGRTFGNRFAAIYSVGVSPGEPSSAAR